MQKGTHQKLFILGTGRHIVELSGLDDLAVDLKLSLRSLQNELLNGVRGDQPENSDFLLLTDSMRSIMSRQIWEQMKRLRTDLSCA